MSLTRSQRIAIAAVLVDEPVFDRIRQACRAVVPAIEAVDHILTTTLDPSIRLDHHKRQTGKVLREVMERRGFGPVRRDGTVVGPHEPAPYQRRCSQPGTFHWGTVYAPRG